MVHFHAPIRQNDMIMAFLEALRETLHIKKVKGPSILIEYEVLSQMPRNSNAEKD